MKARQREAKREQAKDHQQRAQKRLEKALRDSQALVKAKGGRSLEDQMERNGYVPNGKGGWRRLATRRNKTIDKR